MLPASSSTSQAGRNYWRHRELETQQKLRGAESEQLRAVYAELVSHYQRMGALVEVSPASACTSGQLFAMTTAGVVG